MKKIKDFINNHEDIINALVTIGAVIALLLLCDIYGKINGSLI